MLAGNDDRRRKLADCLHLLSGYFGASIPFPAPHLTPRIAMKAHDDDVKVRPLELSHLAEREGHPESSAESGQHALSHRESGGEEGFGEQRPQGGDSFTEWVQHRPKNTRKKYRPTTQGAWVQKQEFRAQATLKGST